MLSLNVVSGKTKELVILAPHGLSPYISINSENKVSGYSIDVLTTLLSDHPDLIFIDSMGKNNTQAPDIISMVVEPLVPEGYEFIALPHHFEYNVFTRKNSNIESLARIYNSKIIVLKNDLPFDVLYQNKTMHIFTVKSYDNALQLLASGIDDCAILPFYAAMELIKKNEYKNIGYISTPFLSYRCGFGVKKDHPDLIQQIKTNLVDIIADNRYEQLEKKWLTAHSNENHSVTPALLILLVILLLIILFLSLWVSYLNQEINSSTREYVKEIIHKDISPVTFDFNDPIFKQLVDLAPLGVFISNQMGQINYMNKEFLSWGLNKEQMPEKVELKDIFKEDTSHLIVEYNNSILSMNKPYVFQPIHFELHDEEQNRLILIHPLRFTDKPETYLLNLIIKPFIEGEHSFQHISPELLFHLVVDSIPDLIFFKNTRSEYLGGNKAWFEFSGRTKEQVVGKNDFGLFNKERAEKFVATDQMVFSTGINWEGQNWEVMPDGRELKYENKKIPLLDHNNNIIGLIGISHDVTRHHLYEHELAKAKERAEESDRIKSSFLANMSHEIRTPMNSIIGFSDLLSDSDLTYDQQIEIIDMIQSNGHSLIDLIDDIIDFSKIEAGQIYLKYTDFNLNSLIIDSYAHAQNKKTNINKEHLNISYSIGSIEDEFYIHTDPFRLRQILKSLLNTGIRYSTSDSLFFGYTIYDEVLLFYVKGNHNVITEELYQTILYSKSLANIEFSSIEEASGISLIIAKNLIEMVGGKLWVEEKTKGQPEYYFTIPLKKVLAINKNMIQNAYADIPDWTGKTILVAEDEETNYILLESIISKTNATIRRANNGKEAVELFQQCSDIDLILMDIRMPEMNGVEASKAILELDSSAIIIAQTAYTMPEDKDEYLKIGLKGVVAKPIDPAEMYYLCTKQLAKKEHS